MLKLRLVCVGKIKEKYFAEAVSEYAKRMARYAEFSVKEVKEENFTQEPSPAEIKRILEAEGENILKELKGYVICFAVEGKKISSEGLAEKFRSLKAAGTGEISFVIGGSYGISDNIKRAADELISMSAMTFPQ